MNLKKTYFQIKEVDFYISKLGLDSDLISLDFFQFDFPIEDMKICQVWTE